MAAYVSLALAWILRPGSDLAAALKRSGYECLGQDMSGEQSCVLTIKGCQLAARCRTYPEDGWVSATIDIDEDLYASVGGVVGRTLLNDTVIASGAELLRNLQASYAYFDEEAEANVPPNAFDGTSLFGITLVPRGASHLEKMLARRDLVRVDYLDEVVVLYRRLDPVPEYLGQR